MDLPSDHSGGVGTDDSPPVTLRAERKLVIDNRSLVIPRLSVPDVLDLPGAIIDAAGQGLLRWCLIDVGEHEICVEATICSGVQAWEHSRSQIAATGKSIVVNLIPTGIGCSVGGFAGDAAPATAVLAATCDSLVTNPNAVNASNFINLPCNVLYTEGYVIDQWLLGRTELFQPYANRIGLVIERCSPDVLAMVHRIVDAVRAVHGVDIVGWDITDGPIGTMCIQNPSGAYVGTIQNPDQLMRSAERLLDKGATAIAVTSRIQGLDANQYADHLQKEAPNPVGGAEAVLSHLLVRALRVPCAHAPIVNFKDFLLDSWADPRGAGEISSDSGLACVLIGLRQAPQVREEWGGAGLSRRDVRCLLAPATALGSTAVICAIKQRIPVIAVDENRTLLKVDAEALGLGRVLRARSYLEAAGMVVAISKNIAIESLRRPLSTAAGWTGERDPA